MKNNKFEDFEQERKIINCAIYMVWGFTAFMLVGIVSFWIWAGYNLFLLLSAYLEKTL